MVRLAVAVAVGVVGACAASCVFDLADVLLPGAGGGGEGGQGGAAGGEGGTAGAPHPGYEVEISYGPTGVADVAGFVAMVAIDATRIDYAHAAADGSDLAFVGDDGQSPLAHEIESWNAAGESIVWVKLPALLSSGGSFFMRYGDEASAEDPEAVWSGYLGVYHLADVDSMVLDASGQGHHGTGAAVERNPGQIGDGLAFDGTTSAVDLGVVPAFDVEPGEQRTFSAWFARATTNPVGMTIGRTRSGCCNGWTLQVLGDMYANLRADLTVGSCCGSTFDTVLVGTPALPNQAADVDWHFVAVVMDRQSGDHVLYLDGEERGHTMMLPLTGAMMSGEAALGVSEYDDNFLNGTLDEARIAATAASADEIAARYVAERDQLFTFGPESER
jgi:hypothetical protein